MCFLLRSYELFIELILLYSLFVTLSTINQSQTPYRFPALFTVCVWLKGPALFCRRIRIQTKTNHGPSVNVAYLRVKNPKWSKSIQGHSLAEILAKI